MHKVSAILNAVEIQLQTISGLAVVRNRMLNVPSLPAVAVYLNTDSETDRTTKTQTWQLNITLNILVTNGDLSALDDDTLSVRADIHKTLKSIRNLNLSFVNSVSLTEQETPETNIDGEQPIQSTKLQLTINYQTDLYDPTI